MWTRCIGVGDARGGTRGSRRGLVVLLRAAAGMGLLLGRQGESWVRTASSCRERVQATMGSHVGEMAWC